MPHSTHYSHPSAVLPAGPGSQPAPHAAVCICAAACQAHRVHFVVLSCTGSQGPCWCRGASSHWVGSMHSRPTAPAHTRSACTSTQLHSAKHIHGSTCCSPLPQLTLSCRRHVRAISRQNGQCLSEHNPDLRRSLCRCGSLVEHRYRSMAADHSRYSERSLCCSDANPACHVLSNTILTNATKRPSTLHEHFHRSMDPFNRTPPSPAASVCQQASRTASLTVTSPSAGAGHYLAALQVPVLRAGGAA
jgi:hypothetical protein